jgi:hypothetical protein
VNSTVAAPPLRPGFLTAIVSAAAAVLLGAGVALLTGIGPASALRTGARAWLVMQGSGVELQGASLGLVPIGGVLLCGALAARVARSMTPEPWESPGAFAATVAGTSGVLAAVLASASSTPEIVVHPVRAAAAAFVVSGAGAALGATVHHGRTADLWPAAWRRPEVRGVVGAGARGAAVLVAGAAVVVAALLVTRIERAGQLWALLDPGAGGAPALALLCLLAVPTLVVWTVSVLLGPGFALGTQTSVDLTGAQLGPVPGLPVLAGLPSPGRFDDVVVVLALLPLLAGLVAGWRAARLDATVAGLQGRPLLTRAVLGLAAGAAGGLLVGVLVGASGGAVGPGRLQDAGPPTLTPLLVAVLVMAVGGALGAVGAHYRDARAQQPEPDAGDADERPARRPRLRFRHQPAGADRRGG